jgi:tol-pal system protein YbgF
MECLLPNKILTKFDANFYVQFCKFVEQIKSCHCPIMMIFQANAVWFLKNNLEGNLMKMISSDFKNKLKGGFASAVVAGSLISSAMPAYAAVNEAIHNNQSSGLFAAPIPAIDLLNSTKATVASNPIQFAQSDDAAFRMGQMEEQMRVLNGKVEDMTFQLLQLQEQIRKMQEDNEYRFQELENRGDLKQGDTNVAAAGESGLGKPKPSDPAASNGGSGGTDQNQSITDLLNGDGINNEKLGEPPISLGTLTFDGDGNLIDSNVGKPIDLTGGQAALELPDTPEALFDLGYQYVQAGQYDQSQIVFQRFVSDFPDDAKNPEAQFWLGESLFAQGNYEEAAKIFLENHKKNPQAPLGAQNLLKLGVSLAGLDQRELACATYAEVPKKYPDLANSVRKRIVVEQNAAKCKNS